MKKLIVVADWAADSLTCQEIRSAVEGFLQESEQPSISFVASTPSTLHTSFILSQIVETEERFGRPLDTVIFQNTDPRLHADSSLLKADGAPPVVARLKSGIYVCGPNAGFVFTLLKHKIEEFYIYNGENEEGQFHSRDLYARMSAHLMDSLEDDMDLEETHTNTIPQLEKQYVAHVDNYGNIKTTITFDDFKGKYEFGDEVTLKMNNITKKAKFVTNLFGDKPGNLVIYPGSSGHKDNRFLEVTIWRHFTEAYPTTGANEFNHPRPGMEIEVLK